MSNAAHRQTKTQRREEARERARQLRAEQQRRERRNRWFVQGGIVVTVLAVIALVVVLVIVNNRPAGPGPRNMASDGALIVATGDGKGLKTTTSAARAANAAPVASSPDRSGKTANIVIYLDYLCPYCQQFETANADTIKTLITSGAATLELHPIAILSPSANDYSKRSANAAACVADLAPNSFFDVNAAFFKKQPPENGSGLTNDQIATIVAGVNPPNLDQIKQCIGDQRFLSWVNSATQRAVTGPLPNTSVSKVTGTPTVIVNGEQYQGGYDNADKFKKFVQDAASKSYATQNESTSPSVTPKN